ncbi:glycine cleavage system protein GcvH [Anaerovorax odorimutans]|uniref:Glycine cleavage system H protein n=1 Tax=Anaerovorax odorimutans TaxID=109327 RepID=A0ABT1RR30_9FIRM|nr:glycine cleavage system protein GcvH [Anaerovorax odorimutans]MCQ4637614.1 glycine cleavage system protein GcvH [Anaerovorax odorimutans]
MNFPKELKYSKTHEWIKMTDDTTALVGLTDYAQKELGDLVFVNLPEEGEEFGVDDVFADVESVKAVSDVLSPLSGKIAEINEELLDEPQLINADPYEAWLVKIDEITAFADFLNSEEYEAFVESLEK